VKRTKATAVKEHLIANEESLVIKIKNAPLDKAAVIAVRLVEMGSFGAGAGWEMGF
jgi:hypothetical protein